jgi:hypothetical protein
MGMVLAMEKGTVTAADLNTSVVLDLEPPTQKSAGWKR